MRDPGNPSDNRPLTDPLLANGADLEAPVVASEDVVERPPSILTRAASATFTAAGAVGQSSQGGGFPRSGSRLSRARSQQVRASLLHHIGETLPGVLGIFAAVGVIVVGCATYFLLAALFASLRYYGAVWPCDEPFDIYLWVSIGVSQVMDQVRRVMQRRLSNAEPWQRIVFSLILAPIPGWMVMGWGLWMVYHTKDCPTKAPDLYYPIKHLIYAQVVLSIFISCLGSLPVLLLLTFWNLTGAAKPGCEEFVKERLPKIPNDAAELIDSEDGMIMDCPICQASLGQMVVVRTECSHHFHLDCLARWCKKHVDCPLCRRPVDGGGTPERSDETPAPPLPSASTPEANV
eukprot:CAMPEP_0206548514 /NCGR_PEP_ID=MMETSP0325_2-20121206/13927_1 /ASSEMBLY_ACC=CAM_ASM_000347 /TAXON_ID=2866 /ORGANISM="Crypthecodinium cohnii, Strain Seligo" /LENGTH=346 /DNA_ID=CAMNT_0054048005 /DNA_START=25 /DNA_END=1065 /DNA_ORIENTATION=+